MAINLDFLYRLRLTGTNNYAWAHGFVGGYPNFHHADYGDGVVNGTLLLNSAVAEWRDVSAAELGDPDPEDIAWRWSATHDYAVRSGFYSGFPNFHAADYGQGTVYETVLIKLGLVEWRDVPAADLGYPPFNDAAARIRATHDYALRHGYYTGFPNFHYADYGQGLVYGTILLQHGAAEWRDVLGDVISLCALFSFDPPLTTAEARTLLERHCFARGQIGGCNQLNSNEKHALIQTYRRAIRHGVTNDADANASAFVGGSEILVNTGNLFPLPNAEIAQTLIHEMMHCAGYNHPNRCDPGEDCTPIDVPGDNGSYYGTAPLRAEFCIAGAQSLTAASARGHQCQSQNGTYRIVSDASPRETLRASTTPSSSESA